MGGPQMVANLECGAWQNTRNYGKMMGCIIYCFHFARGTRADFNPLAFVIFDLLPIIVFSFCGLRMLHHKAYLVGEKNVRRLHEMIISWLMYPKIPRSMPARPFVEDWSMVLRGSVRTSPGRVIRWWMDGRFLRCRYHEFWASR